MLAALVAILSVIAIWTRNQVVDTDRYVRTVAPLATEPPIQDLLVDSLTNAIADPDRSARFAARLLPPGAEPLATPIAAAVESFVRERLGRFIRSPRFAELWSGLSRGTHDSAVRLITGDDQSRVEIVGDQLVVRLGPLLGPARAVFDTLVHYMRVGILIALAVGLVIALGAFAAGRIRRPPRDEPVPA